MHPKERRVGIGGDPERKPGLTPEPSGSVGGRSSSDQEGRSVQENTHRGKAKLGRLAGRCMNKRPDRPESTELPTLPQDRFVLGAGVQDKDPSRRVAY